ncbi:HEAT repeat domain-containing protein [Paludisphaera borealis]|uniref:HEAT repeat domain-containing protein n=1 Tax=Paludisphaera borealis TaxID=1387353 RepID=UPI00285299EA|nr:HEAT repeat domain-containing protein [Paludisphaera borealis]
MAALADVDPTVRNAAVWILDSMGSTSEALVRALVERLESDDEMMRVRERWRARKVDPARSLNRIKPPASLIAPLLRNAMASPSPWVRLQAKDVLLDAAKRPGREDPTLEVMLLAALQDREPAIRMYVPDALAGLGADARGKAVATLLDQLRRPDRLEQLLASVGLSHFHAEASPAVTILSDRLREGDRPRRPATPPDEPMPSATPGPPEIDIRVLRPGEPGPEVDELSMRASSLYLLGQLGPIAMPAVPEIVRAMTASDSGENLWPFVDQFRMKPDSWHGYDVDLELERTVMAGDRSGPSPTLRTLGAAALGRIGPEAERQAVELLVATLRGGDESQLPAAAEAFVALGPKASAAFPALLEVAERERSGPPKDSDWGARFRLTSAMRAVCKDDDPRLVDALVRLLRSRDAIQRAGAAMNLDSLEPPPPSAIPALIEVLQDKTQSVRCSAALALGRYEGPEARTAVPALYDTLRDEDGEVRYNALKSLVHYHEDASRLIPTAIQLLRSGNPSLRIRAAQVLGAYGPAAKDAAPALMEIRNDDDSSVRTEVENALKAVRPTEAADSLQSESKRSQESKKSD